MIKFAAAILLGLALGEAAVRLGDIGPRFHSLPGHLFRLSALPGVGYEFVPGVLYGREPINSDSMRDVERPRQPPPGVYRIACLGDSICAGVGVSRHASFPAVLERTLNAHYGMNGQRFECLNFGVPGYNKDHVLALLEGRVLDFQPDMVLYAYCLNDTQAYSFEHESVRGGMTSAQRNYLDALAGGARGLLRHSRFLLALRYTAQSACGRDRGRYAVRAGDDPQIRMLETGRYHSYLRDLYDPPTAASLERSFARLQELATSRGCTPVLCLFPVFVNLENYPFHDLHARIRESAEKQGIAGVDLLSAFGRAQASGRILHADPFHPDAEGYRLAATAVAGELAMRGLLTPRHPDRPASSR